MVFVVADLRMSVTKVFINRMCLFVPHFDLSQLYLAFYKSCELVWHT